MSTSDPDLARLLTRWFESRLDEMMPPRRTLARRYGLEVIDADGMRVLDPTAVRVVFVCEATDPARVRAVAPPTDGFDATAVVEWGWVPVGDPSSRPAQYAQRARSRDVQVTLTAA